MAVPIELLKNLTLFSTLTDEELEHFYSMLKPYEVKKGKVLFKEGESGEEMFIVNKGKVGIYVKINDGEELEIAEISTGNFFGEMSIFDNIPRSATCITKEDSSLLGLSAKAFFDSIEKNPHAAIKIIYKMVSVIAGRLEKIGAFLSDIVQWGEKARIRAITDDFTGLYNRRFYDDTLKERFLRAKQNSSPLTLAMLDLDHFGNLNKDLGQKAGDQVIISAASVFQEIFRKDDILVRYGGDEFVFVLSDTDCAKAEELCVNVIEKLKKLDVFENDSNEKRMITASIGIANFPLHAKDLNTLKDLTDKALYQAKEKGRNRVVIYKE